MDIKPMENSTVLLKLNDCVFKVKFQYPIKRDRLKTERYSETFARAQICYILNELFTKVKAGKLVSTIQTEYFNVHVKMQEWLLGPKVKLKSERQCCYCYPKVFLLVVELKDFLIKAEEMLNEPTLVCGNTFKMSQNKAKICEKTVAGHNNKEEATQIFVNNISRPSSSQISTANTLRTLILATPKLISEENIRSKSCKKRGHISEILNKHDNAVRRISTPVQAMPRRQCPMLSVDLLFRDGNTKFSNPEQKLFKSSKHFNEKFHQEETTQLKLKEIYKPSKHTGSSNSHAAKSRPPQHNVTKLCDVYNYKQPGNNQASQKMRKDSQQTESDNNSILSYTVSEINLRQKVCSSTSENKDKNREARNDNEYFDIKKRKIYEVTDNLTELNNIHKCKKRNKQAFKKMYNTGFSNSSDFYSIVNYTSDSCLYKTKGNVMENIQHIPCSLQSAKPPFSHMKQVQQPSMPENVTLPNELTKKMLQHNLSNPENYLESQQQQPCHYQSRAQSCKPVTTYAMPGPIQSAEVLPQSSSLSDIHGEIYDCNNSCTDIENPFPANLYKDDVCLFSSPEVKLVKNAWKKS